MTVYLCGAALSIHLTHSFPCCVHKSILYAHGCIPPHKQGYQYVLSWLLPFLKLDRVILSTSLSKLSQLLQFTWHSVYILETISLYFKNSSWDFDQNYLKSIDLFGEELILLHWVFQSVNMICSSIYLGFWFPLSVFCTNASQFMLALQLMSYFRAIVNSSVLKFCVSTLHD